MKNEKRLSESVEELIQHYQSKADKLKTAMEDAIDSDATITVYKWMHSLWSTCCSFVADLDELATHCEVAEFIENCQDCGFCNKQ